MKSSLWFSLCVVAVLPPAAFCQSQGYDWREMEEWDRYMNKEIGRRAAGRLYKPASPNECVLPVVPQAQSGNFSVPYWMAPTKVFERPTETFVAIPQTDTTLPAQTFASPIFGSGVGGSQIYAGLSRYSGAHVFSGLSAVRGTSFAGLSAMAPSMVSQTAPFASGFYGVGFVGRSVPFYSSGFVGNYAFAFPYVSRMPAYVAPLVPAVPVGYGGFGRYGTGGFAAGNSWFGYGGFGRACGLGKTYVRVIQNGPNKSSGNYYQPSSVDPQASGSYYASSGNWSSPVPASEPSPMDYWGPGGNPFGSNNP